MILAGAAASAGVMIHAGTKMYETIGPSRMALDGAGGLWMLSHGKLHHFGDDGMRHEVADLGAIGAPKRPSDFDMHRDGRAVLADPDTSELVRCKLPNGPCERLPARLATMPGQEILPLNAAKVHVDDAGGRYYVSDNYGGRIVAMDFAGNVLARTKAGRLHHPNQLSLTAADRLTVVNTDWHELVTFDTKLERAIETMSTAAPGVARRGRTLPFDSVRLPDGGIAVLIAMSGMRDADLVKFEAGTPVWRADLGRDADPFDAELWRGKLWVVDATRYRVDAVGLDGKRAGTIEDAAFLDELDRARHEPEKWRAVRRAAQLALVALPLLGAIVLWRLGPAKTAAAKPAIAPAAPPVTGDRSRTFGPRAKLRRNVRLLALVGSWGGLLLAVALLALLVYISPIMFFGAGQRLKALPVVAEVLAFGVLLFVIYRAIPRMYDTLRLAFDAKGVRYQAVSGYWPFGGTERGEAPWSAVYADDTRVLVGSRLVPHRNLLFGDVFEKEDMAALLAALPEGHRVPPMRMTKLAWQAGALRRTLIGAAIGLAIGLAIVLLRRGLL